MAESAINSGYIGGTMIYQVELDDLQECFLNLYLATFPLREGHTREMYPGLIAKNFINSMMGRTEEVKRVYKEKYGEEYHGGSNILDQKLE
jgi:hypothetical protein